MYASAVIFALPAPQVLSICRPLMSQGLSREFIVALEKVEFQPCLSVMAGFSESIAPVPAWQSITWKNDAILDWVGLDSSKRPSASLRPFWCCRVRLPLQPNFLKMTDITDAADQMLTHAAQKLSFWIKTPQWMQIHRWRYAFATGGYPNRPVVQSGRRLC